MHRYVVFYCFPLIPELWNVLALVFSFMAMSFSRFTTRCVFTVSWGDLTISGILPLCDLDVCGKINWANLNHVQFTSLLHSFIKCYYFCTSVFSFMVFHHAKKKAVVDQIAQAAYHMDGRKNMYPSKIGQYFGHRRYWVPHIIANLNQGTGLPLYPRCVHQPERPQPKKMLKSWLIIEQSFVHSRM